MEQTFNLAIKDGRKVLVMMAGITLDEVKQAIEKATPKIKAAKNPRIECNSDTEDVLA